MLKVNPLSWTKYVRSNLKRVFILILTIMLGIFLIVISNIIVFSMENNMYRCWVNPMKRLSVTIPLTKEELKTDSNSEMYKVCIDEIYLKGALGKVSTYAFFVENEGIDYIINKLDISLIEGDYPHDGNSEIAIHRDLARNKNVNIGDYIGKEVDAQENINGKYKVVGIFDSDSVISLGSLRSYQDNNYVSNYGYIYSSNENIIFSGEEGNDFENYCYEEEKSDYENSIEVVKLCLYLIIGFIYIIVGFTILFMTYIFFSQRKKEICILIAVGRTKFELICRSLKEIMFINSMGCIIGCCLASLVGKILNMVLFDKLGQSLVIFRFNYIIIPIILVCLLLMLSILMIRKMIRNTDYVSVIEGDM